MNSIITLAQATAESETIRRSLLVDHLVAAVIFSVLGIAVLLITLYLMCRFAPFSVHKEIEEDQNTALGIVMGSVLLGVAIIIAAAIIG